MKTKKTNSKFPKHVNIVIPMAGLGSRFATAGYSFPKPLIDVKGKPMIEHVIKNLTPKTPHHFIFICQKEHYDKYSLNEIFINTTNDNFDVVKIAGMTEGAVCTVLNAADYIDSDTPMIIANSDQIVDLDFTKFVDFSVKSKADGVILTFDASHPKWSYARCDKKGKVVEVAEKKVISPHATVGVYYFKNGKEFIKYASRMIEKDIRVKNEFYVCPVYNEMILDDKTIRIFEMKSRDMHGLGTPEDLENYLKYIENKKK